MHSALPQSHLLAWQGLELLAQLGRLAVVAKAETKRHTVDVEEVHIVKAPCRRVHSPMEYFYSPSWTCML